MPELIPAATRIPVPGGKVIDEHVGAVTTPGLRLAASVSVAHMVAPPEWSEPFQTPEFDEITLVLAGRVLVEHDGGTLAVDAGQTVVTHAGERIRYSSGPEGARYVAICLPAFSPRMAHREDDGAAGQ
ncbi:MAG TPA: cupin [Intrasporangium sp.]|uniref:cupin domain-containing protein n=1 Tax=Intrasporangium sp. TaxID=1925024 RepID=UPI002D79157C|nr:cupin [Intrasporangium sp.]HET7397786.1 cupin [Intrasporangium sp.]